MPFLKQISRDWCAGILLIVVGIATLSVGQSYGMGDMWQVGPGFFPTALGAILAGLGVLIALIPANRNQGDEESGPMLPDARGACCIVLAMVGFLALARNAGLAPAAFACVFVGMLGDRKSTLLEAGAVALAVTIGGSVLFAYVLQIPLPLLAW
jgi:hypothetical protein